ncbi:MAG: LysM peptidoglycan-binding domain-containing protein, partial [Bacillota bacterium]
MEKNKFFNILIIISVFLLAVTISVSAFQVKLNDRGKEVIEAQKHLEILGYEVAIDGIFGKSTEDAAKKFQAENNLQVDGIIGGKTLSLLKEMISEKVSYELYVVDKGDTLSAIADSKNISLKKLKKFNNLGSAKIKVGQDLKIPRKNIAKVKSVDNKESSNSKTEMKTAKIYYTIRPGDTLSTIAARRNLPVEEIMNANNLSSDFIKAGEEIVLPITDFKQADNLAKDEEVKEKQADEVQKRVKANNSAQKIVYEIQRGDALSTIAKMYGTNVETIRRNNNLNGNRIFAGDKLIIKDYERKPFSLGRNSLIWPVKGRISSKFGWRTHPIKKTRLFHNGLDIAVPKGTAVRAAASGKVVHSGWMNGFG